jgi:hypothetical protein
LDGSDALGNGFVEIARCFAKHEHFRIALTLFRARGKQATIDFSETEADWKDWKYIKEYVLYTTTYPKAGYLNKHFCLLLIYWGCFKFLLYLLYDKAKRKIM